MLRWGVSIGEGHVSILKGDVVVEDNRAEVMMEAGLGFVRAGDRATALSFFADAAALFSEMHDHRSAASAQAWLDAGKRSVPKRAALQVTCSIPRD
jgi:hypothetical protein